MYIFSRYLPIFSFVFASFSTLSVADEYHYNNMLIGDRASGMGGAYTAISDDATGMFYNPAGILYVGERNFSASVNAYYSQSKKYENVIGNRPFERNSSALLANFFGIVKPMGNFKVGFSYAVPDAVSEDQNQNFSNVSGSVSRFTMNLNNRDSTYNFGPSIAAELSSDLSVGLSLYIHKRDVQLILNQFQERTDGSNQWSNYYFKLSETGTRPVLGVMWSPVDKLSLGASLSQTWVLAANGQGQSTCWDSIAAVCNATILQAPSITSFTAKRKYPLRMAVGAAYFPDSNLILSGDVTYNAAVTDANYGNKEGTLNMAIGTEYYLNKNWAVRTGGYTNMANTPVIQAGVTSIEERINLYGVSLSVSNFTNGSSITLGTSINYGKGKSQILNNTSVQDATTLGWLMFLSSSY
ncbi:MAG: hypothetical protein HOO97_00515 [Sideroxydans sp.]|nr:hypothetical protein [Sideroxydans sp.]NOT97566.1 hypothetical protein [Sideroxydans sp.]